MNSKINFPFLRKMEQMLKALSGSRFEVKPDGDMFSVHFKRVVVVGPLPDQDVANSIAAEYNDIIDRRVEKIHNALEQAEKEILSVGEHVLEKVNKSIEPPVLKNIQSP